MQLTSPAFNNKEHIPYRYSCKGQNINPPLVFHDIPENTKSFVLIIEDIDAEGKPWVHWLVYNIPSPAKNFPENGIPQGAIQGICNGGTYGYEGPCPIYFSGIHHYYFRLYALDVLLDVPQKADKEVVLHYAQGHILAAAELIGIQKGKKI